MILKLPLEAGPDADPADLVDQTIIGTDEPVDPIEEQLTTEQIQDLKFYWVNKKFPVEIAAKKGSNGVMIFYADDQYYDINKLQHFVDEGRDFLSAAGNLPAGRIQVLFGGYGANPYVEYYIVPKGSKPPEPNPEERPVEQPTDDADN